MTRSALPSRSRGPDGPIILVHGAWHGGWVWQRLRPLLEAHGHRVAAPTLTGLGDRAAPQRARPALRTTSGLLEAIGAEDTGRPTWWRTAMPVSPLPSPPTVCESACAGSSTWMRGCHVTDSAGSTSGPAAKRYSAIQQAGGGGLAHPAAG